MNTYIVKAVPWVEGWELHVDGIGVTQVRTLDKATQQVQDFLETLDVDISDGVTVALKLQLGGLEDEVEAAREAVAQAEEQRHVASVRLREVAQRLRNEKRLSVTDSAVALGVSRGRVSQLVK